MYCISCGKPQPAEAAFCPFCGKKQLAEIKYEARTNELLTDATQARIAQSREAQHLPSDFPGGDLTPIFISEKAHFMFRRKSGAAPLPWTEGRVDLLLSNSYVFFQAANVTRGEEIKNIAALGAGIAAGLVPIVGLAVGAAALAVDKALPKQGKSDFGMNNQFTKESLLQKYSSGQSIWIDRRDCEFRAMKSRLILETYNYFAFIGKFHHAAGMVDLAVVASTYSSDDLKKSLIKAGCTLARDDKYSVRSEVLRSIDGYPEPAITKEHDDAWYKY